MLELMPPFYFLTFAKVSVSVSKTFGLKKSLGVGLENIWSRKKVSVSVLVVVPIETNVKIFQICLLVKIIATVKKENDIFERVLGSITQRRNVTLKHLELMSAQQ